MPKKVVVIAGPSGSGKNTVINQIIAQYPLAGTEMTGTSAVNLLVNNNANQPAAYVMPDLIGKPSTEVEDYFKEAGLRIGLSQPVDYPGIASGTIVKQNPPAGYKVTRDTYITLYYAK